MKKLETKELIRMWIEEENREQRFYFKSLGSRKGCYSDNQKQFAINTAKSFGVRATSRLLNVPRKTIQRWLRAKGITAKRCPAWVYDWVYWRKKRREKFKFYG